MVQASRTDLLSGAITTGNVKEVFENLGQRVMQRTQEMTDADSGEQGTPGDDSGVAAAYVPSATACVRRGGGRNLVVRTSHREGPFALLLCLCTRPPQPTDTYTYFSIYNLSIITDYSAPSTRFKRLKSEAQTSKPRNLCRRRFLHALVEVFGHAEARVRREQRSGHATVTD